MATNYRGRKTRSLLVLLVLLLAFHGEDQAQQTAETKLGIEITSLPYPISAPGVYILKQDFLSLNLASGSAITINASDVVLDLNGHTISNTAAGAGTTAYGVLASDQSNVTVRHGSVQGFMTGVAITASDLSNPGTDSYGHTVEKLHVSACTYEGISVAGANSIVRSCQVENIGGSSLLGDLASAYGIDFLGKGLRCMDCDVSTVTASGTGGVSYAIYLSDTTDAFVLNNRLSATGYGLYFGAASGQYRHNLATGMLRQGYVGGTDAGKNIVDSDSDGLDDDWEMKYLGNLNTDPNAASSSGSGLTIQQAYQQGVDPNDFYIGKPAKLNIVSGNNQSAPGGNYLSAPLVVSVTNSIGTPAMNVFATFTVTGGGALLKPKSSATPTGNVTLRTDSNGQSHVYVLLPALAQGIQIAAASGNALPQTFNATATAPPPPGPGGSTSPPTNDPFAPSNVVATLNGDGSLDVTWTNNADNDDPGTIDIQDFDENGVYHTIATAPAGAGSYHIPAP